MNERVSNKLRTEVLKGLSTIQNIREDSTDFFDKLIDQSMQMITKNSVPNEELHHNKNVIEPGAEVYKKEMPEAEKEPEAKEDAMLKKLCAYSDEDFARLKEKIAEAEILRKEKK